MFLIFNQHRNNWVIYIFQTSVRSPLIRIIALDEKNVLFTTRGTVYTYNVPKFNATVVVMINKRIALSLRVQYLHRQCTHSV